MLSSYKGINIFCMYDDGSFSPLLKQVPRISRARDFRLYTHDGRRFTDLWQYGGKAVLGHTVPHQLRELKNNASRGLFVPFPNHLEGRLEKALERLFPKRVIRIYKDKESMQKAFEIAEFEFPKDRLIPDPALGEHSVRSSFSLWRPFINDEETVYEEADILLPILPFPGMNAPKVLLLEKNISKFFPPSDVLSLVLSSALLSSVTALIKQMPAEIADYSQLTQNLSHSSWQQRKIYLMNPSFKDDLSYEKIFHRFLDGGFLIPPKRNLPLILPVKQDALSHGELAKLYALFSEF